MGARRLFLVTPVLAWVTALTLTAGVQSAGAVGEIRHATPTGSGTTCSDIDPCDLQTAVESAASGDQVVVHPGTYSEATDSLDVPAGVSVGSVAGQSRPRLSFTTGNVTLGAGASVSRLGIETTGGAAALVGAPSTSTGTADRLIVHASGGTACQPAFTLLRNTICWSSVDGGYGVATPDTTDTTVKLRNVTAVATGAGGVGIAGFGASGAHIWVDAINVIADGETDVDVQTDGSGATSDLSFENSNFIVTNTTGLGATIHELGPDNQRTTGPTYVNAAAGDFHQQTTSVTVDGGLNTGETGDKDIDGNDRQVGPATDIGADEYAEPYARVIGNVSAFAGVQGTTGQLDGPKADATFQDITGIAKAPDALYLSVLQDNGVNPATGWIRKLNLTTGQVSTLVTGTFAPVALAYSNNTLYVSDPGQNKVHALDVTAVTPTLTDFATGLDQPEGITTDGKNVYVAQNGCGPTETSERITAIPIGGGGSSTVASFPKPDVDTACNSMYELAYGDGMVFATDRTHLFKVDPFSGAATTLISSPDLNFPTGIDVMNGLLYLSDDQIDGVQMWAVDPQTGNYSRNFAGSVCGAGVSCSDRSTDPHLGLGVDVGWHPGAIANDGTSLYVADRLLQGGPTGWTHHMIRKVDVLADETPPDGSASAVGVVDSTTGGDGTAPLGESSAATLPPAAARMFLAPGDAQKIQLSLSAADTGGGQQSGVRWFQTRSGGQESAWLPVISNPSILVYAGAADIRFADRTSNVSAWKAITFPPAGGGGGDGVGTVPTPGGTPVPPPGSTSTADKTAPALAIGWKAKQKLGKFLVVTVTCKSEPCTAKAAARVAVKRGTKTTKFALKAVSARLAQGRAVTLKLAIPAKLRKAGAAALKARGKLSVALTLTATDAAGNKATAKRSGILKR